ncbi:MAG: hypothetical protein LBB34_01650, partial [Holosporales bacterium]|nr:hypothetical protein [Holosporales bacterium]
ANEVCKGLTGEGLYENLINYAKGGKDAVGKSRSSGLGSGPGRVTPKYGKGEYWDKLVTDKASAGKAGIKPKDVGTILGKIQRAKRQIGGDIRADAQGNLYKFDPAHKSSKVHLERIEEREGKFVGTGEVDPVTGKVAPLKDGWRKY